MDKLHMDSAPFIRHGDTTKTMMADMLLVLGALGVWSVYRNGLRALVLMGLTVLCCCVLDYLATKLAGRAGTVRDLSAAVTGMILAGGFPAGAPLWLCPVGALLAIGLAKALPGGLGKNRVNPAAFALLILHLCFPLTMGLIPPNGVHPDPWATHFPHMSARPTLLDALTAGQTPVVDFPTLLSGQQEGLLLYTPAVLIGLCAVYLWIRHTADCRATLSFLATGALASVVFYPGEFALERMGIYLLGGGAVFAAVFMLTDPVTGPATNGGRWLFGALAALLCFGMSHFLPPMSALYGAVCLADLCAPLLEYLTLPTPFGKGRRGVQAQGKRHRDYVLDFAALLRRQKQSLKHVEPGHSSGLQARVLCGGTASYCSQRFLYDGAHDCASVSLLGGSKHCYNACEGFGDCVKACSKNAIVIVDGLATVDPNRCNGCGDCLNACPKRIITLLPAKARYWVGCLSPDDPVSTRKNCQAGCIGCHRCEKVCPTGAIRVEDRTARIYYQDCISCGNCYRECPRKCIWELV